MANETNPSPAPSLVEVEAAQETIRKVRGRLKCRSEIGMRWMEIDYAEMQIILSALEASEAKVKRLAVLADAAATYISKHTDQSDLVHYDGTDCDGTCLVEDIDTALSEGKDPPMTANPTPPLTPSAERCREIWKPLVMRGKPLLVSNLGRVKNKDGLVYKQGISRYGYSMVFFAVKGKRFGIRVNRAVLLAFRPRKDCHLLQAAHLDGVRRNNALKNLAWKTPKDNDLDKARHGTLLMGDRHSRSKLREKDIPMIRWLISIGLSAKKTGKLYGVSDRTILDIRNGLTWKYVKRVVNLSPISQEGKKDE